MAFETEIKSDFEPWICDYCVHYPPSSCDGKPCTMCDPDDPLFDCFCAKEN